MSLFHSYSKAKQEKVDIRNKISDYPTKRNYGIATIKKHYGYIAIQFYSLDFYGASLYHHSWDYWRKDRVQYSFHHNCNDIKNFNLPFYYLSRSKIFQRCS